MKKLIPNISCLNIGLLITFFFCTIFSFDILSQPLPSSIPTGKGSVYHLPVARKADLQKMLDAFHRVVLENGDYTVPNTTITLKSGYQLCGDPAGTSLSPVIFAPGTTDALLSTVTVKGGVSFPASSQITRGNVIERLIGGIRVTGGTLQDNLFLHIDGPIYVDNSQSGFMRNNRFIRCKVHAVWPQLTMLGDSQRQSSGNVFLWFNFLTPHGDATNIMNQKDLTIVGIDAETWNQNAAGTNTALIKTGQMGTLRIFGMNGGNHGKHPTPAFDVAADEFQIYNNLMEGSRGGTSDYVLRPENLRSFHIGSFAVKRYVDEARNAFRISAFEAGDTSFRVNGAAMPANSILTPDQQKILTSMVTDKRPGKTWEKPRHRTIPNPAGAAWDKNLKAQPDQTDYIQGLIDANGVARLPAGIYYISRPLKVKTTGGIIGAGADKTAIIALNNKLDMIVANDKDARLPVGRKIILSGLTLQGGANGIHFEPVGTGTLTVDGKPISSLNADGSPKINSMGSPIDVKVQYTACYFNDVTFLNMSEAGIFMDQIYALDNIFMSYLNFVNCDTGWKQKVSAAYVSPGTSGETSTMMYMDKVMLYGCQFVGNRIALDFIGNRSCNLNAWVNCKFENNREGVAVMRSYHSPLFGNCDFINNGGASVVYNNQPVSFVGCRFKAGQNANAMFGGPVSVEGCSFDRDGSTKASILKPDKGKVKVFFTNCLSKDMPLGLTPKVSGIMVNSVMVPDDHVNQRMVLINSGSIQPILKETTTATTPMTQLLFGSDWSQYPLLMNY
ncbi:MAG: hypothetical protein PHS30_03150 [Bacteroidales bacterium]|nr:hypothetical protein [Bacteroidales bacterium]